MECGGLTTTVEDETRTTNTGDERYDILRATERLYGLTGEIEAAITVVELPIQTYAIYEDFAQEHSDQFTDTDLPQVWALLCELDADQLFIRIPRWLADQKIGFFDGGTPTDFIGQIDRETDKAVLFTDSMSAQSLFRQAHLIQHMEQRLTELSDADQRSRVESRLEKHREEFTTRPEHPALDEEWLPKSQIELALRCND